MDLERFTSDAPGKLVKIELLEGGQDWAFVPHPLPRDWRPSSEEMHDLLGEARERLGTLNGIGHTLLNPDLLLRPLRQREAILSSRLEGTHVEEVAYLGFRDAMRDDAAHTSDHFNSQREVANYARALEQGTRLLDDLPLCGRLFRELHGILLRGVRGREKRPGQFRDSQVHVGLGRRFNPPPYKDVDKLLAELESSLNEAGDTTNPLIRAFMAHYQFETIHPFADGNGRIGRVLLSLCTYHWHGHAHPLLYMSPYFEQNKDDYIDGLFRVSTHGDWDSWIAFCLRGAIAQCADSVQRCKALTDLRQAFHETSSSLGPRMRRIVDAMFEYSPVFSVSDVMSVCSVSRPTAQKDIDALVEAGIVAHAMGEKPRIYVAPSVIDVAYDKPFAASSKS